MIFFSKLPQPVVREKERDEDRRDADRHEPFIAEVTRRMKGEALLCELVVELLHQRLELRAVELEAELGDFASPTTRRRSDCSSPGHPCAETTVVAGAEQAR
jgi:hypothetical protein